MLPRHTKRTPITLLSALLVFWAACSPATEPAGACSPPRVAALLPAVLDEASGIAISRQHDGVLWVINDTEPVGRFFAIDSAGIVLNEVRVRDSRNIDWEDIAVAPCEHGQCLYIAEIGDNLHERDDVGFYRVPEPSPADSTTRRAEWFPIRYPTGPQDAEALFVMPGERVYIISKGRNRAISLYRYPPPLRAGETVELELLQELSDGIVQLPEMVTGAGATHDGSSVAVRSYGALQLYRFDDEQLQPLLAEPIDLRPLGEPQGEGVDIRDDGWIVLTGERGVVARPAPLSTLHCRAPIVLQRSAELP